MNRRVAINLTVFGLIFAWLSWWSVNNIVTIDALERPYRIAGDFEQTAGILPRAEVAYLGVNYGTVDRVERRGDGVRIYMDIQRDKRIPAGSTANVFRKSAIGEPYIDFFPPEGYRGGDGPHIRAGDVVPRSRTTVPLEFSELLRSASALIAGIDPARLQVLVHELATGLHGRADSLRRLTRAGDELSREFAARTAVLDRLATNNTRLTRVVAEHRHSLGGSIRDLRQLADSLRRARSDTTVLLDRGARFLTQTADLVGGSKGTLDCMLSRLETVIEETSTPSRVEGLRTLLQVGPRAYAQVWDIRDVEDDGVWVRVGTLLSGENPAKQYVPPRDLPEVGAAAPCESALAPAPPGTRLASASAPAGPSLGALLALAVLTAAAGGIVFGFSPRRSS